MTKEPLMHQWTRSLLVLGCLVLLLAPAACRRSETPAPPAAPPPVQASPPAAPAPAGAPFRITGVEVGNAIGADKRITAPSAVLAPTDTIYASVSSDGTAPAVTLTARWLYEDGQIVNESTQSISSSGPAASEFHVAKPDGWPAGRYQVQILANGAPVATKQFEVR
jgi:hypothetical protein